MIVRDKGCLTDFPGRRVIPGFAFRSKRLFPVFTWKVTGVLLKVFLRISTIRRAPIKEPLLGKPSLEKNTTFFFAKFVIRK